MGPNWNRFWLPGLVTLAISLAVAAAVVGLRMAGALQPTELAVYDQYVRMRHGGTTRTCPITIVAINDEDYRNLDGHPLRDRVVADLLDKLAALSPSAIGLDLIREMPVPFEAGEESPGAKQLAESLRRNKRIIAIYSYGRDGNGFAPPKALVGSNQLGFADLLLDQTDGVVRRALIYISNNAGEFFSSFALEVALLHLNRQEVYPDPQATYLKLGDVTLKPFESNDGGYRGADANGYQFLMDYRGPDSFLTLSVADVLAGRVKEQDVRDRIVLIGTITDTVKDYFHTPINRQMYGVEVHARIVDQLVRAALHGERPTSVWPAWTERGWAVLWAILGGVLGLMARTPSAFCLGAVMGIAGLGLSGYLGMASQIWVPVVPPSLTWLLSSVVVMSYSRVLDKRHGGFRFAQKTHAARTGDGKSPPPPNVFISAKSADYEHAQKLYDYLTQAGVQAFFSRETLAQTGNADFRKEIDIALDHTKHMIVVTSSAEHVNTSWVESEWGFFVTEKRSGRKAGNVITVTAGPVEAKDLPPALRRYEIIPLTEDGCARVLSYVAK